MTLGRIAAAHGRFSRIRQLALVCTHQSQIQNASLGPAESTSQMQSHRFNRFCAHGRSQRVHILYNGPPFSSSTLPIRMVDLDLPSKTWFLGPTRVHDRDRQTHRQRDRARDHSLCKNRPHNNIIQYRKD